MRGASAAEPHSDGPPNPFAPFPPSFAFDARFLFVSESVVGVVSVQCGSEVQPGLIRRIQAPSGRTVEGIAPMRNCSAFAFVSVCFSIKSIL